TAAADGLSPDGDRRDELRLDIPGKEDPGVLAHLGDEGVDQRAPGRLGVDRGEMRLGQKLAHDPRSVAGIDQIVDDEIALAIAGDALQHRDLALDAVSIARDADRVDEADIELA